MTRYAILCGCAPDGFTQKKINEMHDFLTGEAGGSWAEKDIVIFPNGVSEAMLSFVLERLRADKTEQILLYICTLSPTADDDESVWLGGEEIRKSVIEASASSATWIEVQVVYDCGRDFMSDEEMEQKEEWLETASQSFRGDF
ncbi:hypothetical protein [uncultured Treponema sp.]|uniref:hypothetical protein n=1 Tax=uncultured Treponema sp. TaxID=162155 RepID=UPI00260FDE2F|nr:hypothetical protein [uncultured Treponema sp.]